MDFLLGLNWVDLIILIVLGLFIWRAWKVGFWVIVADFVSFFLTLVVSLKFYPVVSEILKSYLSLGRSISNAIGFLLVALISEVFFGYLIMKLIKRIPKKYKRSRFSKPAAILPAIGQVAILASFFLTMLFSFPIAPKAKIAINDSKIGGRLLRSTSSFEASLTEIFGDVARDSLTHLVVKPGSKESVILDVDSLDLAADGVSELAMFNLINAERASAGVSKLKWRADLVPVARNHASDMWENKYFSHYSPEGLNVGTRLENAKIDYFTAGENLALSPTLDIAHTGLMNSQGHRENLLSEDFSKVGIGVIDNGFYGKIFVQIFTD